VIEQVIMPRHRLIGGWSVNKTKDGGSGWRIYIASGVEVGPLTLERVREVIDEIGVKQESYKEGR